MISVITVSFNSSKTIRRTIESLLFQEYESEYEYIIVDGDSQDGTKKILREYERAFLDKKVKYRWISEKDNGIYDAMNKGIRLASGDFIGILNSDDFYEAETIKIVDQASKDAPNAGVIYGMLRVVTEGEKEIAIYRYRYEHYLLDRTTGVESAAQHPACFVRKNVYNQVGLYNTEYRTAADYDFLIRAMIAGVQFYPLNKILTNFTKGGISESISDYDKAMQRWSIQYRHGLMSEKEYSVKMASMKYRKYALLKRRFLWLFLKA